MFAKGTLFFGKRTYPSGIQTRVFGLTHLKLHMLIRSKQNHLKLVCLSQGSKQNSAVLSQSLPSAFVLPATQVEKTQVHCSRDECCSDGEKGVS